MADNMQRTSARSSRQPRLIDIARAANVSVSTVSRAITGAPGIRAELRRQVIETAGRLGYDRLPSERGVSRPPAVSSITLITGYQYLADHSNNFYNAILEEIRRTCGEYGIELKSELLDVESMDLAACRAAVQNIACESVMTLGLDSPEILDIIRGAMVPAIIVNGDDPEMQIDSVSPAYRSGAHLATRHLIELGHKRLLHITALYRSTCRKRLDGFRDALRMAHIPFAEELLVDLPSFTAAEVESAMLARLKTGPLDATAAFCVTDSAALGLMSALRKTGYRVPDDISVVGFDDMPASEVCSPRLTTIHVAREDIGRAAVTRLLERVSTPGAPAWRVEVGGHLVPRQSVRSVEA